MTSKIKIHTLVRIGGERHRVGWGACTACGKAVDTAGQIASADESDAKPSAGDFTVCLDCGHLMAFADDKGQLRDLTDEEMSEIAGDERVVAFNTIRKGLKNTIGDV